MNYTKLLPIVLIVGVVGVLLISQKKQSDTMILKTDSDAMQEEKMMEADKMETGESMEPVDIMGQPTEMIAGAERYVPYVDGLLEKTSGRKVLFFYANWCPTCKPANESFMTGSASVPEGVTIVRVNYNDTETSDEEKALAQQYGVTYQHTYVELAADGTVVQKWNGGGVDELVEKLQ